MVQMSIGVIAGGKAAPNQNKSLHQLNNRRFIRRITKELGAFSETLISGTHSGGYEELGLPVLYDEHRNIGPMEGIYQVLMHAANQYVFVCAVDMPFITRELVEYMAGYICPEYDCYVLADEDHLQPLCAIYSRDLLPVIEELIACGRYRLTDIFSRVHTRYIRFALAGFDRRIIKNFNIRTKQEPIRNPVRICQFVFRERGKLYLIERVINEFIIKTRFYHCYKVTGMEI